MLLQAPVCSRAESNARPCLASRPWARIPRAPALHWRRRAQWSCRAVNGRASDTDEWESWSDGAGRPWQEDVRSLATALRSRDQVRAVCLSLLGNS